MLPPAGAPIWVTSGRNGEVSRSVRLFLKCRPSALVSTLRRWAGSVPVQEMTDLVKGLPWNDPTTLLSAGPSMLVSGSPILVAMIAAGAPAAAAAAGIVGCVGCVGCRGAAHTGATPPRAS